MELLPHGTTTKGPAETFTGDVYFDVIAKTDRMRANLVRFTPGATPPGTGTRTGRRCT